MKAYSLITTAGGFTVVGNGSGSRGLLPSRWLKPGDGGNVCASSRKSALRIESEDWRWCPWTVFDLERAEVPETWYVAHEGEGWAVSQTKYLRIRARLDE